MERTAPPSNLFGSLRQLGASLVAHLYTRLELLKWEYVKERGRLATLLISSLLALFFAFLAIVVAAFGVIAMYWDTPYRMNAIGYLLLAFVLAAVAATTVLVLKLRAGSELFESSLAELKKDHDRMESAQ